MKININNYEEILLDFLDGNLSENEKSEVFLFLEENPKIKFEFESFNEITLEPSISTNCKFKNEIKKIPFNSYFDITNEEFTAVALLENDLLEVEKNNFLNSNLSKEITKEFAKTKLIPDLSIKFKQKKQLKKKENIFRIRRSIVIITSIAASLVLFFIINNKNEKSDFTKLATIIKQNPKEFSTIHKKIKSNIKTNNNILHKQSIKQINFSYKVENQSVKDTCIIENENFLTSCKISPIKQAVFLTQFEQKIMQQQFQNKNIEMLDSKKNIYWEIAEISVKSLRFITSGSIQMSNKYEKGGKLEQLNLYTENFKVSKSF